MTLAALGLLMWAVGAQARPVPANDDLTAAKTLYAQGTYEDALLKLSSIRAESAADEVDEYRALCHLALGKTPDALKDLETLFTRSPLFKMSDADVPPRLVTMYHDVRRRLLPAAIRAVYGKAKGHFDQKSFSKAAAEFKDLLALINDDDLGDEAAAVGDLKQLGEGFLKLSEIEIANAEAAAAKAAADAAAAKPDPPTPPPPKPGASDGGRGAGSLEPRIFSDADKDVTPPVEISRFLPDWNPANPQMKRVELRGAIRVVIDEAGKVETVALAQSVNETYDQLLLAAARQWTFKPATRNGQPVKFQKVIAILLSPR